ncbi:MAG: hypothetical protein RLZZ480_59 [Candidatus Parcubacteria bacterium]|jgi:hypothetical protein
MDKVEKYGKVQPRGFLEREAMKGVHQKSLRGQLYRVESHLEANPIVTIDNPEGKLAFCKRYIATEFGEFNFLEHHYRLPFKALRNFSFDEIFKMSYSSIISPHESVDKVIQTRPNYTVVRKIKSSMWRWGYGSDVWNEVVDAYEGLRSFSLDLGPDFDIRLDYTTGHNKRGYSRFTRTFLDGVFAFLIYYKRKHVMTIGFSFMKGRRLLLQQVQLKEQQGNRWLFRFPKRRLEFVLERLRVAFPVHELFVVDGESTITNIASSYEFQESQLAKRVREHRERLKMKERRTEHAYFKKSLKLDEAALNEVRSRLGHIAGERDRLVAFYRDVGDFQFLPKTCTVNGLLHHHVVSPEVQVQKAA